MKGLLVRVGIDSGYGHWNGPVDVQSWEFAYLPIEETGRVRHGLDRRYDEMRPCLERFGQSLPKHLVGRKMHLDPDFQFLTYGDSDGKHRQRAKQIQKLERGDILAFYAGLRDFKNPKARLVYALIGLYIIRKIRPAKSVSKKRWKENAHTRRVPHDGEIVVRAKRRVSGRLVRCIPMGEWRNGCYRVQRDILKEWGELSVKDGFIQRSGYLPEFKDAEKFYRWFKRKNVPLIKMNNP